MFFTYATNNASYNFTFFKFSIIYLMVLFVLMLLDHYLIEKVRYIAAL